MTQAGDFTQNDLTPQAVDLLQQLENAPDHNVSIDRVIGQTGSLIITEAKIEE